MTRLALLLSALSCILGAWLAWRYTDVNWLNAAAGWLTLIGFALALWNMWLRRRIRRAHDALHALRKVRPYLNAPRAQAELNHHVEDGVLLGLVISTLGNLVSNYAAWLMNILPLS